MGEVVVGVIAKRLEVALAGRDFAALPGDVQLAVMLSAATRIEPELVRAMRLATLPLVDVSAESDLWFGDWVGSRAPGGVALRRELLPVLRERLKDLLAGRPDGPAHSVWRVLEQAHDRSLSPALRLEERVVERVFRGQDPEPGLRSALLSLAGEGRKGLADWVYGAWGRLPEEARGTVTAWLLHAVANRVLGDDVLAPAPVPERLRARHLLAVRDCLGSRRLSLSWHGDVVWIGGAPSASGTWLDVPDTEPALVDLLDERDDHVRTVQVHAGRAVPVAAVAGRFTGLSGDGTVVRMGPRRHTVEVARPGVRPSRLLADAQHLPPVGRVAAQRELTTWFLSGEPLAVRLLHGSAGAGKAQLTHLLESVAANHRWDVRRSTGSDAAGVLLVVDAASWTPAGLARLVAGLRPPVRVLVTARDDGAWWEAARHFLTARAEGVVLTAQRLAPHNDPAAEYAATLRACAPVPSARAMPPVVRSTRSLDVARMAAVATALGGPVDDVAGSLLELEVGSWRGSDADRADLARTLVVATLAHPLPRPAAARALVRAGVVARPSLAEDLLTRHDRGYPPTDRGFVAPLGPSCLGEALIARAVEGRPAVGLDGAEVSQLFRRLVDGADEVAAAAFRNAVLACDDPDEVDRLARTHPHLAVRASHAVLAKLAAHARLETLQNLWRKGLADVHDENGALGAVLVLERLPGVDGQGVAGVAERYAEAGLVGRAVRAMTNAVSVLRVGAAADPVARRPELAEALSLLSRLLLAANRHADAITAAKQAIETSHAVGLSALTGHQQVLAHALLDHGTRLSDRGDGEDAADAAAEAIRIYRGLNGLDPHRYDAQLVSALRRYAAIVTSTGRPGLATESLREALALVRPLALRLPAVYRDIEAAVLDELD